MDLCCFLNSSDLRQQLFPQTEEAGVGWVSAEVERSISSTQPSSSWNNPHVKGASFSSLNHYWLHPPLTLMCVLKLAWYLEPAFGGQQWQTLSCSAHIQIAQVPDRNEPDSAGELNYSFLFNTLEKHGYQGYIGCEYKPLGQHLLKLFWKFRTNILAIVTFGFRFHKGGTGLAQQIHPAGHDYRRPLTVGRFPRLNYSIDCPFRRSVQSMKLDGNCNKSKTGWCFIDSLYLYVSESKLGGIKRDVL